MNQYANMYPGQPQQPAQPQAPTPHAGGFDPQFAPQQHVFVPAGATPQAQPGFIPAGQPHYAQPQAPVYQPQPQAPVHFAQPQYAQPPQAAPQHQAYAQPAPVLDAAYEARMRQAAMGNGRRQTLPIAQSYVVDVESSEVALVGPPQGRQQRVFFAHVTVVSSSNPAVPVGHKAKLIKYLESDYDMDRAMGEFKALCASFYGDCPTEADLWAKHPDWLRAVQTAPGPFVGARLSGSVAQSVGKDKRPLMRDDGTPKTRETWQRIG